MKKIRKIIPILIILLTIFATYLITDTYAKYKTSVDGEANMNVAQWKFKINNEDINYGSTDTIEITPTFTTNPNIKEGVIAPTSEGYFDLIIDYTNVDVAFSYKLVIGSETNITDFTITGYDLDNSGTISSLPSSGAITGNVLLNSGATTVSIRVYIEWNDDEETETMSNSADTSASVSGEQAKLSVSLQLEQVA